MNLTKWSGQTLAFFAILVLSSSTQGAIFWQSGTIPSESSGSTNGATGVTAANFTMEAHADATPGSPGEYPGGPGTAPDVAMVGLSYGGMFVNGSLTPVTMSLQELPGITPHGLGENDGRVCLVTESVIPDGSTITWQWSYAKPMTSANQADQFGFGANPTGNTTDNGSMASLRASALFPQGTPNQIFDGGADLTVTGNVANIANQFTDNFNDASDLVSVNPAGTFDFSIGQFFDGVSNSPADTTWTTAAIDDPAVASDPMMTFETLTWTLNLEPGKGDLPSGVKFAFTFDGVPVPEPESGGVALVGLLSILGICIRRRTR